jgi:hypothetical protein
MASPEDLYRELQEQEEADDRRYRQQQAMKPVRIQRRPIDSNAAKKRFQEEIEPVLEARRRVANGQPPTRNPLVNLMLKIRGEDKLKELPPEAIIEPSKGLVVDGPTIADAQKAIAENPMAFRDLAKMPEEARKVEAKRRGAEDLHHD